MLKAFILSLAYVTVGQAALAETVRLTEQSGRWVCQPDSPGWPQILIDFTEKAYRCCDQNTCVTYPLREIRYGTDNDSAAVLVRFGEQGRLIKGEYGGAYQEHLVSAGMTTRTTGNCAYRGHGDIYEPQK